MLKRLAVVVFLAIVLPVYGQKESSQTGGGKSDSNSAQNPTPEPSGTATCTVKEEGTTIECRWPKDVPESKFRRFFSPENAPNIGLFFVGLLGVGAAYFTLRAINKQAELMKQSADISRGATVPTLRMLNFDMGGSDPLVDHEMELNVRNYGATPAILDALYISFDDGERWPTGEGESVPYSDPGGRAVAANSEVVIQSSPYICLVSPHLIHRFRREQRSIYVHGRLKYRDVFDSPARNLRFDVHLNPTQNGTIRCEITGQWNEYDKP